MKQSFVVADHHLVPKHVKLSKKDKDSLLKEYNIDLKHLPFILIDDPALKELKVKVGDIIKVLRHSHTAGESIGYRVVVSSKDENYDGEDEGSDEKEEEPEMNPDSEGEEDEE